MQSQQFQNVQQVILSLRKAATQQKTQNKFIIILKLVYVYRDGLGNLYPPKIEVKAIRIPIQLLKKK